MVELPPFVITLEEATLKPAILSDLSLKALLSDEDAELTEPPLVSPVPYTITELLRIEVIVTYSTSYTLRPIALSRNAITTSILLST